MIIDTLKDLGYPEGQRHDEISPCEWLRISKEEVLSAGFVQSHRLLLHIPAILERGQQPDDVILVLIKDYCGLVARSQVLSVELLRKLIDQEDEDRERMNKFRMRGFAYSVDGNIPDDSREVQGANWAEIFMYQKVPNEIIAERAEHIIEASLRQPRYMDGITPQFMSENYKVVKKILHDMYLDIKGLTRSEKEYRESAKMYRDILEKNK